VKIIFLLDNDAYLEVTPENLQLRSVGPGQAALGVNITVPVRNEDGTPKLDADGKPQTAIQPLHLINYAVDLIVPGGPDWKARAELAEARVAQLEAGGPAPAGFPTPAPVETPVETPPTPVSTAPTKAKRLKKKSEG
jgi:hypothetical protein